MNKKTIDDIDVAGERRCLRRGGDKLVLPVDAVIADRFDAQAQSRCAPSDAIPPGWRILDIGPKTVGQFKDHLRSARTVVWNGPMGAFEMHPFSVGAFAMAHALAELSGATTLIGGGDSAAAVEQAGVAHRITHVSANQPESNRY